MGFDFDCLNGDLYILLVETEHDLLSRSNYLDQNSISGTFRPTPCHTWSFFDTQEFSDVQLEKIAKQLSEEFSSRAIYFYHSDTSGWTGYTFIENGDIQEEYDFGINYEEDIIESGLDLEKNVKDGTVIGYQGDDYKFIFWGKSHSKNEEEICLGEVLIDRFLHDKRAYIGWDLYSTKEGSC